MAGSNHSSLWEEATINKHDVALVVLLGTLSILVISWYKKSYSSTRKGTPPLPPGPKGLPIVGYLPFLSRNLHHEFAKMANQYGPIFKLYLGSKLHIVVNSADLAKVVTGEQDESFANRSLDIASLTISYGANDIAFQNNNSDRRYLRKVLVHGVLTNKKLEASYAYRRSEVRKTIKNVHDMIGTAVDINDISFSTVLNTLTHIVWGKGFLEGTKYPDLAADIREAVLGIAEVAELLNISDFFPMLARFDLQSVEQRMKRQIKKFDHIFETTIEDRIKKSKIFKETIKQEGREDFLQFLLELLDQNTVASINRTQLKGIVMDIFLGGVDATSAMTEWAMAEILGNPKVVKKVQDELVEVVGLNNIVEESHLPKLKYLDAVLKETFRLHPPVPFLLPRSPDKSCVVGGYTVPKGATVLLNVWGIQRDPQNWANPSEFNPERFLNNNGSEKWDYIGTNSKYLPFGSGRRRCPGYTLGEKIMMHILASLMHSFDWSLPKGEVLDLSEKFGIALKKKMPLVIIPSPRLSDLTLYS